MWRRLREYKNELLQKVICNHCGKELKVEQGILKEGCFRAKHHFDYFSDKDGMIHEFDLCEACYDKLVASFVLPVTLKEETEFL